MNVARLRVLVDGSAAGALKALAAARIATKATANVMNKSLLTAPGATTAGFAALGAQAATGGAVALTNALLPLVGVAGLLPGAVLAGAAAAGTLKLGLFGVADALKETDPKKLAIAMGKLTPAARDFVSAINALKPAFTQLRLDVQQSLFDGLGKSLSQLAGSYLPRLHDPLSAIARDFNEVARQVTNFLTTGQSLRDFDAIMTNIRHSFANARGAAVPFVQVMRDLTVVSAQFLPQMGTGLTNVAGKLRDMTAAGRESGAIADFIQDGITAAKTLGRILGDVGGILHSVFAAGGGAGLLTTIEKVTAGVDKFLKGTEGKSALAEFFKAAGDAGRVLMPILGQGLVVIGKLSPVLAAVATGAGPGVVNVLKSLGSALGAIDGAAMGKAFGGILTTLGSLLPKVVPMLLGLVMAGLKVAQIFATGLIPLMAPLSSLLTTLGAGFVALASGALVPLIQQLTVGLVPILNSLIPVAVQTLSALVPLAAPLLAAAAAVGQLLVAAAPLVLALVAALVPAIQTLAVALADSQPAFAVLVGSVADCLPALSALLQIILPMIPMILEQWAPGLRSVANELVKLTPYLQAAAGWMARHSVELIAMSANIGKFVGWLAKVSMSIELTIGAIEAIGSALGTFTFAVWTAIEAVGKFVGNSLFFLSQLPAKIVGILMSAAGRMRNSGRALMSNWIDGIASMAAPLINTVARIMAQVRAFFPFSPAEEGPFSGKGWTLESGKTMFPAMAKGWESTLPGVKASLESAMSGLSASMSPTLAGSFAGPSGLAASGGGNSTVVHMENHFAAGTNASDRASIDSQVRQTLDSYFGSGRVTVKQNAGR